MGKESSSISNQIRTSQLFTILFISRAILLLTVNNVLSDGANLQDYIISTLLAMVGNFVFILPIYFLFKAAPGKDFYQLSTECFGKFGKVAAAFYGLYFLLMASYYLGFFVLFMSNVMEPYVSLELIALCVVIVACYAAWKGTETIARTATVLTIVVVAGLVFIIAALIPKINLLNYLPFFDEGPDQALKGTALLLSRSSGLAVLLLVLPKTKGRRKPGFILWNILIVFLMVATLFVIVGAMGSYLNYQLFPVYSASSFADAGVMERMDALFIAMWISSLVIKLAFDVNLFTGCAQHIKSGFKKWPVIAGGAVVAFLAVMICKNLTLQRLFFGIDLLLPVNLIASFVLTALMWIIYSVKQRKKGGKKKLALESK